MILQEASSNLAHLPSHHFRATFPYGLGWSCALLICCIAEGSEASSLDGMHVFAVCRLVKSSVIYYLYGILDYVWGKQASKRARFSGIFCWGYAHWAADAGSSCLFSGIWRKIYMGGTLLSVFLLSSNGTELGLVCVEEMSFVASSMEA